MAGEVVGGQAVELGLTVASMVLPPSWILRLNSSERRRGFLVEGLQVVAGGLVLVNAGQAVAKQRALDVVFCGAALLRQFRDRWPREPRRPGGSG
jgi:hypothetical protein